MASSPRQKTQEITISEMVKGRLRLHIVGQSPLIMNSMNVKAIRTLLLPEVSGRKSRADRARALKHDVLSEYRNSTYRDRTDDGPTRLQMPGPSFKSALMTAALDLPGTKKTEIGRLTWVAGYRFAVWGAPKIFMSVVRSSDIQKTPDVRTRAILPEWCAAIDIEFVRPNLTEQAIVNLSQAAGLLAGIGDFRQEKGKGSFGQFRVVGDAKDAEFRHIQKAGGRAQQDAALEHPDPYDEDTREWLDWYQSELPNTSKIQLLEEGARA